MTAREADKPGLGRRLLDGLSLVGGLIALFQFVVSDNVSSHWFKPIRDWIADKLDLSEELAGFNGWWDSVVDWMVPDIEPLNQMSLWEVILIVAFGLVVCSALGAGVGWGPFLIAENEERPSISDVATAFCVSVGGFSFYGSHVIAVLMTGPPLWVQLSFGATALAGLIIGVWLGVTDG